MILIQRQGKVKIHCLKLNINHKRDVAPSKITFQKENCVTKENEQIKGIRPQNETQHKLMVQTEKGRHAQ